MIKKCPQCGSEKFHRNDVGKITCFKCGYVWRKYRKPPLERDKMVTMKRAVKKEEWDKIQEGIKDE